MDSKQPTNQNPLFGNIKIKVEPGTSNVSPAPPAGSITRLTSFRLPRDLTLGGAVKTEKLTKKVYTPNINVQRNKKKEDGSATKAEPNQKAGGRGRGRGAGERGRGRGKAPSNLIQSSGVFSEGMSGPGRSARRSSSLRNGTGTSEREPKMILEKSKLNLNYEFDKDEEDKKLKLLLRDDFIDDGDDLNLENAPIVLPLMDQGKLYKDESKVKENIVSDEEEEEVDQKPIILENGRAVMPPKKIKRKVEVVTDIKHHKNPKNVPQIISNQSTGYLLVTFPDCLPGVHSTDVDIDPRLKKNDQKPSEKDNSTPEYCTLHTLKDGPLGKIQIHKSGKAILRLGDNSLVIDVGSRQSFRQDLIAAKVDASNSELINLGQVTSTLICSPDWESMLANL